MIELLGTFTLFGSVIWAALAILGFIIICFFAEGIESGWWSTIGLIVLSLLVYKYGDGTWEAITGLFNWIVIGGYLVIGLIHSYIRVFFYGRKQMKKYNEQILNGYKYPTKPDNSELKEHVFRWWLNWPFSLIMWFIKDMIKDIWDYSYSKLSKTFNYVLDKGINSVEEVKKPEKNDSIV